MYCQPIISSAMQRIKSFTVLYTSYIYTYMYIHFISFFIFNTCLSESIKYQTNNAK